MIVFLTRDNLPFVMYCVNGKPRSSLFIESTDSMITKMATKTLCSVCLRGLSVTTAGLIRVHGPVGDRCGSRKPPKQPDASPRLTSSSSGKGPNSG